VNQADCSTQQQHKWTNVFGSLSADTIKAQSADHDRQSREADMPVGRTKAGVLVIVNNHYINGQQPGESKWRPAPE